MTKGRQGQVSNQRPESRQRSSPVVLGNVYDKYSSRNPIARYLLRNFLRAIRNTVTDLQVATILEVGCGEGFLSEMFHRWIPTARIYAVDLSAGVFDSNLVGQEAVSFCVQSAYGLGFPSNHFDLVVGAEVLEHLRHPAVALKEIHRVTRGHALFSVPREPLWRIMNLARLAYLSDWGNTPGHLQHWAAEGFVRFVARECSVIKVSKPLPWTVVLAAKRDYPS